MARDESQEEGERGGSMSTKKIMIIVGAAVLINVAVIVGVLMFTLKSNALTAGGGGKAEHGEKKGAPAVYALEPFIVNIRDGQEMRYLKLKVELETTGGGPELKAEFDPYLAPLRDSILALLSSKSLQDIQDLAGKNRLRDEVLAATGKILPAGKVSRVFFTDFVVQ
jgi:flagellar FliL protein